MVNPEITIKYLILARGFISDKIIIQHSTKNRTSCCCYNELLKLDERNQLLMLTSLSLGDTTASSLASTKLKRKEALTT